MLETRKHGEYTEITAETSRPFRRVREEASRGLLRGFSGLFSKHRWKGHVCHISGPGVESTVAYKEGRPLSRLVCRVRFKSLPATLFQEKILSDVEALTLEVSGDIAPNNQNVFIVHGHDLVSRSELKVLLQRLGATPVILEEQDDLGLTIIEKFEYYGSNCAFAVILMTPDDMARSNIDESHQWRARQNVIMELGWFMARLGRERVVLLHKEEVEVPSDVSGVIYMRYRKQVAEVQERILQRLQGVHLLGTGE